MFDSVLNTPLKSTNLEYCDKTPIPQICSIIISNAERFLKVTILFTFKLIYIQIYIF